MPKTNDATGATYAGYEGVVEHAGGFGSTRPGGLSQLDPSREVDGSVTEGFESEEREIEDRQGAPAADFGEVHSVDPEKRSAAEDQERQHSDAGQDEQRREAEIESARTGEAEDKGGEQSSDGSSSSASSKTRASSASRSSKNSR